MPPFRPSFCTCAVVLLLALGSGCGHKPPATFTIEPPVEWNRPAREDVVLGVGDVFEVSFFKSVALDSVYILEPGDKLEVIVRSQRIGEPYRLAIGDRIQIIVKSGEVQGPYRILPDGVCTLPLLGAVPLEGMSIDEARRELVARYRTHYTNPTVDLLVVESADTEIKEKVSILPDGSCALPKLGVVQLAGKSVEEATKILVMGYRLHFRDPFVDLLVLESRERLNSFFDVLLQSPGGAFRQVTVTVEGVNELPLIPTVYPLNRTLEDVRREIQAAYARVLPHVQVGVNLVTSSMRQVAVMGEVKNAGRFDLPRAVSPMTAIAMAGGFTDSARRSQVLLVHLQPDGSLLVRELNMKSALNMDDPTAWTVKVEPYDLLYVPKSKIAKVNLFVRQYITELIPVDFRVGAFFDLRYE